MTRENIPFVGGPFDGRRVAIDRCGAVIGRLPHGLALGGDAGDHWYDRWAPRWVRDRFTPGKYVIRSGCIEWVPR